MATTPTPPVPAFVDGQFMHQADLNALGTLTNSLYVANQGGFRTRRPQVAVRVTGTGQSVPDAANTTISWDVADINTDNMWSISSPNQITVNTAGTYFVYLQVSTTSGNFEFAPVILVNGSNRIADGVCNTSSSSSAVSGSGFVTVSAGSTIFGLIYERGQGAGINLSTAYGGTRMAAHYVSS